MVTKTTTSKISEDEKIEISKPLENSVDKIVEKPIVTKIPTSSYLTQNNTFTTNNTKSETENKMTSSRNTSSNSYSSNNNYSSYNRGFSGIVDNRVIPDANLPTELVEGILDPEINGHGILRTNYFNSEKDIYISTSQLRRFKLRPGDMIKGPARKPKESERYWGLLQVTEVSGIAVEKLQTRVNFDRLTPVYPDKQITLTTEKEVLSTRIIDIIAPIGKGQRGMIVSPPKAGKTTILKEIANGIAVNHPEIKLMAVLVGERPEEATDIARSIKGEVASSNFDEPPERQVKVAELALERAKRLVELGNHVVILLDSITRLARAYNLAIPTSGRTLSGGFDPAALYPPKRFFGAARNFENFQTYDGEKTGSLTILGTALVDTGSRMDDLIYEEFKGTGNMELHLDRQLAERRVYPAIDIQRSSTRMDMLLYDKKTYEKIKTLMSMIDLLGANERTQMIMDRLSRTKTNKEFLESLGR